MSRLERHRARREGEITGVGKNIEKNEELDTQFDVNPIIKRDEKTITRQKSYDSSIQSVKPTKNIEALEKAKDNSKIELFDIEEAFARLEKKHSVPDHDTQLEIMSELFSENGKEYNSINFEKDETTNKIMISEEELVKLLEKREQAHIKEVEKKRKNDKKNKKNKNEMSKYKEFEELNTNDEVEVGGNDSLGNKINKSQLSFDDFEKSIDNKPWLLYIVVIVLLVVFAFLVYTFLGK